MRLFSTPEGDAGFALKGDDIVSVFKHPKAPYRHVTRSMLDLAVGQGGKRLDAFDTVLPHFYAQSGFRSVARLPFSDEHKPDGWKHEDWKDFNGGRPDVVFMAHDPQAGSYQPGDGRRISDYDEGEVHQRAALAHVAARGNVPAAPGPEAYGSGQLIRSANPLTVWHGTPHEFPGTRVNPLGEFSMAKIGAGEGAQVYGRGIYQAESKPVAEEYRHDLEPGVTYKGTVPQYSRTDPHANAVHQVAEYMRDQGLPAHEAIAKVSREYRDAAAAGSFWRTPGSVAPPDESQRYLGVHMAAERLNPADFAHDQGHLYESQIHIDPDHMLHYDKPFDQQSPYVQHRLTKMQMFPADPRRHQPTGAEMLNDLSYGSTDHAAAAQALLEGGIPGIRYLDAHSRNAYVAPISLRTGGMGHGVFSRQRDTPFAEFPTQAEAEAYRQAHFQTHNYVVFDPRTINIVRRNGLPAMIDAGADALRDHKARS